MPFSKATISPSAMKSSDGSRSSASTIVGVLLVHPAACPRDELDAGGVPRGEAADPVELALEDPVRVRERLVGEHRLHRLDHSPSSSIVRPLTTDSGRSATGSRAVGLVVAPLHEQPAPPLDLLQRPAALQLLALQPEGGVPGRERLFHRLLAQVLVGAAVPNDHRSTAVLALRDHTLEVAPREGVVVNGHGQPLVARVHRRALRHRPGPERPGHLEPEVVVHAGGVVLLDHEARHSHLRSPLERLDAQRALVTRLHLESRV